MQLLTAPSLKSLLVERNGRVNLLQMLANANCHMPFFEDGKDSSYLSPTRKAKFFRRLMRAFPELLDLMCTTNPAQIDKILRLKESVQFMCINYLAAKEQVYLACDMQKTKCNDT